MGINVRLFGNTSKLVYHKTQQGLVKSLNFSERFFRMSDDVLGARHIEQHE